MPRAVPALLTGSMPSLVLWALRASRLGNSSDSYCQGSGPGSVSATEQQ